jgi:predicted TIM-barrel fold metal-dependent hydrolase
MTDAIPILDTHQHLIYPERWPYSWTNDISALAGKGFRYADYVQQTRGANVAGTIFMETSPDDPRWREETKFVYELSSQPGSLIKGVIANCRPEEDGFDRYVESLRHPKLVGFRRILHVVPDELSRSALFAENVRWLGRQKLTFDMCFLARQLPIAIELAKKCPQARLILDHCGVPDIAAGALDPWRDHIRDLAKLPNVACKISGVLAYCKPGGATRDAVKPFVDHCIESFGPDRCVWGSDWPVVVINSTLPEWIRITRQLVAPLSETEQRQILRDNAIRIYGVKS